MSSGSSSQPPLATVSGQTSGNNNNNDENNNNDNSDGNARYCGSWNRRGGRGNNNNNNNNNTTCGPFKGKATDLNGFIYDVGLPISNNVLFSKTTKEIAEYVSCTIEGAGDFHLAMVDLAFPVMALPPAPVKNAPGTTEPSWVDKEQYKLQNSKYIKKMDKRSQVQTKVFPLVSFLLPV